MYSNLKAHENTIFNQTVKINYLKSRNEMLEVEVKVNELTVSEFNKKLKIIQLDSNDYTWKLQEELSNSLSQLLTEREKYDKLRAEFDDFSKKAASSRC